MPERNNPKEIESEPEPQEAEGPVKSAVERAEQSIKARLAGFTERGKRWLTETFGGGLTEEEAEEINATTEVSKIQAEAAAQKAEKSINEAVSAPEPEPTTEQRETTEPTAVAGTTETEPQSPAVPEQPTTEAATLRQTKLEARFGEEAKKLEAEYLLENEKYKEAIDEIIETVLSASKQTGQAEAQIIKKMAKAFGEYFSETPEEQREGACWEIFNAIKNHIADEAAKTEPKSLKRTLAKGTARGALYFGAGLGSTMLLGPLGGILVSGGLRQVDNVISHLASKRRLKEYKETMNTDEGKEQFGNTITDLILAKKKQELLTKKLEQGETWQGEEQKDFAMFYKETALEYLKTHQAEEIEGLDSEQLEKKAESIAVYFAMDDNTEKMQKELEMMEGGKENTRWKSLAKVFGKIDNTPSKKFYSAAAATSIGLGIRGAVTSLGMSSKWVRRSMMAFAGYKLGGALGEIAAGKLSPEATAKKSLQSLKAIELSEVTDQAILENYSNELTIARVALSEISQTAKNKVQIEKWQRELEKHEFELLNETIIKNTDQESDTVTSGFIYGDVEKGAKKVLSSADKLAKASKVAGRISGALLGFVAADVAGAVMEKIRERIEGGGAAIPQKPEAPTEEELEFLKPEERMGPPEPNRSVPAFKHEIGKAEMPEISAADFSYKGGGSVWEESENQLKAVMGSKFENLPLEERNILIDRMKDSIVKDIGNPESSGYYNKMTENDLKAVDWEKYVKGTITGRTGGLITSEIQHQDIPEPVSPQSEALHGLAAKAEITQGAETPKPKKGFSNILEKATGEEPRQKKEGLSEVVQQMKSSTEQPTLKAAPIIAEEAMPSDNEIPAKSSQTQEIPEPAGGSMKVSKVRADVEKAIEESIKTKEGTQKLATLIKSEPKIDKQLKKTGINYKEWEKLSPRRLSAKLSKLPRPQQQLYRTKTFIVIAKETIAKAKIEK